jgi:uncharacterized protein YigE (DUF2233 family)
LKVDRLAALLWAALVSAAGSAAAQPAPAQVCERKVFENSGYIVCSVTPGKDDLRLFWRGADGQPFRTFSNLADALKEDGQVLVFAMNAGMYRDDFTPIGLYIEHGAELRPADTTEIKGSPGKVPNFYKKPNGVFLLGDNGAEILTTDEFLKRRLKAAFATQSGPMLVIEGKLHPALIPGSTDRTRRSGVGVCGSGIVRFAISDGDVNFHDFARLFRDELGCPNALFLDGGHGTGIYQMALGMNDFSWHGGFGPIVGLVQSGG